jgi:NAD-dependent dihydropyrimidine dehydrogenase PreA subunit
MPYVITQPCLGHKDTACWEVCPANAIHPGPDDPDFDEHPQLYIDPTECIDCGACEATCPQDAVFTDIAVPEQWRSYIALNADATAAR